MVAKKKNEKRKHAAAIHMAHHGLTEAPSAQSRYRKRPFNSNSIGNLLYDKPERRINRTFFKKKKKK